METPAVTKPLESAPWYVDVLNRWGIPTVFALVLLYFLIVTIGDGQKALQATQLNLLQSIESEHAAMLELTQLFDRHHSAALANTRFLGALCFNSARSDAERQRCQTATFAGESAP